MIRGGWGDLGEFEECKQGFIHDTEQGLCRIYRRNTSVETLFVNLSACTNVATIAIIAICLNQITGCLCHIYSLSCDFDEVRKVASEAGFDWQYSAQRGFP